MLREAKATVDNRVKPDQHFIRIVFCSFLFLSARFLCSLAGYTQKPVTCQHILDIVGLSQAEVWKTYLNLFNIYCYSFMKTNLTIIKAYQNAQGFVGNNYLAYYAISLYHWSRLGLTKLK